MISLKTIAKDLGLSVSTLSMAINDHHSISAETKKRVLDACAKVGWHNIRRTKRGRPRKVPDGGLKNGSVAFLLIGRDFDDPAYSGLFQGVATAAREAQLSVISCPVHPDDFKNGRNPAVLNEKQTDGVILSGLFDGEIEDWASRLSIPVLLIGTHFKVTEIASCEIDIAHGTDLLLRHLRSLGHENIGLFLEQPRLHVSRLIHEAYVRDCLENEHLPKKHLIRIFDTPADEVQVKNALAGWLDADARPTAVILPTERLIVPFTNAAKELGLTIPDDFSITAFSNPGVGVFYHPPFTVAYANTRDVGRGAVKKLLGLIQDPAAARTKEVFPMYLRTGESSSSLLSLSNPAPIAEAE